MTYLKDIGEEILEAAEFDRPPRSKGRQDGYGSKIPLSWMIRLSGSLKVWRRVYYVCWSNSSTTYIEMKGHPFIVVDLEQE